MYTQSPEDHNELRKVEDKLRAKYFRLIERVEKEFEHTALSKNESEVHQFLMDNNFIFGAWSVNVALFVNYKLTNEMMVDCLVVGEKLFAHPVITFVKLGKANFSSFSSEKEISEYLTVILDQVQQWSSWLKTNANTFEQQLRKQIHRNLPNRNYPSTHPDFEFLLEFAIVVGHKSILTQEQLHLLNHIGTNEDAVKVMTYDSMFKTIYEKNNKVLMSSGWWTEDICASENVPVLRENA
jgi:hypothetical protein